MSPFGTSRHFAGLQNWVAIRPERTCKRSADRDGGHLASVAGCERSQSSQSFRWRLDPAQEQRPLLKA